MNFKLAGLGSSKSEIVLLLFRNVEEVRQYSSALVDWLPVPKLLRGRGGGGAQPEGYSSFTFHPVG